MKARWRSRLAPRLQSIWYRNATPPLALRLMSAVYRKVAESRLQRPQHMPPCPVIVVGNLTAGGSGKTPVVAALARHFQSLGLNPAIITRGYGGDASGPPMRVGLDTPVRQCGDEARLLADQTGVPVWVCRKRLDALSAAVEQGASLVISDDGLQHVALPRSYEICLIDQARGFGNGWLLPAGPLRQSTDRLASVDARLYKQAVDQMPPEDQWSFRLKAIGLRPLNVTADNSDLDRTADVDAVAGIADPEAFFVLLERQGMRIRRHPLIDHQPIDPDWLAALEGPIVMTAKDAARLESPPSRTDIFVLDIVAELPSALLDNLNEHVRKFSA